MNPQYSQYSRVWDGHLLWVVGDPITIYRIDRKEDGDLALVPTTVQYVTEDAYHFRDSRGEMKVIHLVDGKPALSNYGYSATPEEAVDDYAGRLQKREDGIKREWRQLADLKREVYSWQKFRRNPDYQPEPWDGKNEADRDG